jgi:aminodeoxyfutalosine deaminase
MKCIRLLAGRIICLRHARQPARFFDDGGLLGPATLAVHGVQLTPADAALLKERGVTICLCPRSNERLAVGTAPVHLFTKLGIPLCLGTDSLASNDSLSLWDEIRFALDCYRGDWDRKNCWRWPPTEALPGSAWQELHGLLEPGKRADFQVLDLTGRSVKNRCSFAEELLASRLCAVFSNGAAVFVDHTTAGGRVP